MTEVESRVLAAIKANPLAAQQQLAEALGMSREAVAGHIMRLTRKGLILGKGYILPPQQNILVLGGANVDLTGTSGQTFRSGDSNPGQVLQSAGGVGRNIAENLARLGNPVAMLTLIGHDNRGRYLLEQAREAGIQTDDFIRHPDFATSTYLAMNNEAGELVGAIADMAIIDQLTPELLAEKLPRLQAASLIVVEANLPELSLQWLAEQRLTMPLVADAVSATKAVRLRPLLPKLSLLKVNRAEAMAILAKTDPCSDDELIDALFAQGVEAVLLSLSAGGVYYADAHQRLHMPVPACQVQSDTGAGDALLAGFVHLSNEGEPLHTRLAFALACAATTLQAKDAVNAKLSETFVTEQFADYLRTHQQEPAKADSETVPL